MVILSDRIFGLLQTTIMVSFSCMPFLEVTSAFVHRIKYHFYAKFCRAASNILMFGFSELIFP